MGRSRKRNRDEEWEVADDVSGAEAWSRVQEMIRQKSEPKQKELWWDAALVSACSEFEFGRSTVSLLSSDKDRFERNVASLDHDFYVYPSFALIESKLYAFGDCEDQRKPGSRDFYVCDLKDESQQRQFSKAGALKATKYCPLVVPLPERRQILIIAIGMGRVLGPHCELLELPSEENGGHYRRRSIEIPWQAAAYDPVFISPNAHGVVGDRFYIQILSPLWNYDPQHFYLDLSTLKWTRGWYTACSPPPRMVVDPSVGPWPSMSKMFGDKVFYLSLDASDVFFVGMIKLKDLDRLTDLDIEKIHSGNPTGLIPSLKALQELLNSSKYSGNLCTGAWVMPLDHDNNLFCLFAFLHSPRGYDLLACKFELSGMATDDHATPYEYECNILSTQVHKHPFRFCGETPLFVLTRADCYEVRTCR